jgi:hydrogenase expression/formation protein HypE
MKGDGNKQDEARVVLAHGGGGELMNRLLKEHVLPAITNPLLAALTDGAVLPWPGGELVFTTDSFVVTPLEFPGGDIGVLAVAGTVNDLSVMGAEPIALSLGLILEEGLPIAALRRVVQSIARTAKEAGVEIVTGDTKVIERRGGDGLFINTAGVGRLRPGARLDVRRVQAGDAVLVNSRIAEHGLTVMSVRSGIEFESALRSDAKPLNGLIAALLDSGADVRFIRDATRGGVAGVLADISEQSRLSIAVSESSVPMSPTARHAAEMLGLDPITVAHEGVIVGVIGEADADKALTAMRRRSEGRDAAIIGRVTGVQPPLVEMQTAVGGRRIVQRPYGEELPRIC